MLVGETDPAKRRVIFPIYLDDGATLSTDGAAASAPPAGTIQVSINGAAFANGLGSFAHVASGLYYYQADPTEVASAGFLQIKFVRTGFKTDGAWTFVGQCFALGETTASKLRAPIAIFDTASPPALVTGAETGMAASDLKVSINANAFANATGTLVQIGSGFYYYQGASADAATGGQLIVKFERTGFSQSSIVVNVDEPVSSGLPDTAITDATTPGDLSADPATARWTPIHIEFPVEGDYNVTILARIGDESSLWLVAYDEKISGEEGQGAFSPLFAERSEVAITGTFIGGRTFEMDIIPNGGWQRPDVLIVPYIALELTL